MQRTSTLVRSCFALLLLACTFALQPAAFAAGGNPDARFDALSKRYVDEFGRYSPVSATQLGDHRFDGELDDLSAAGRARTLAWVKGVLGELQGIDRSQLSRANQVDAAMLENQLRYSVWSEEKFRDWSWDPLVYTQLAGQSLYGLLAREFAPLPQRLNSVSRPAREAARPARADARQHRSSARAGDPRRNRGQAEPGRAEPGRRTGRAEPRAAACSRPRAPRAGDCRCPCCGEDAPAMARADAGAAGQGRVPHRSRTLRREARLRADVAAQPRRDPATRRDRGRHHAREDVRGLAAGAGRSRRRAADSRRARRRPSSRPRSRPRSTSRVPSARRATVSSISRSRCCARPRSSCARRIS